MTDDRKHPFRFEATITLGTVIHVVMMAVFLIVAWVHVNDRLAALEESNAKQQILFEKESALLSSMQMNQAQQTVIIQGMERRLGIVEDVNGLLGKKHNQ